MPSDSPNLRERPRKGKNEDQREREVKPRRSLKYGATQDSCEVLVFDNWVEESEVVLEVVSTLSHDYFR